MGAAPLSTGVRWRPSLRQAGPWLRDQIEAQADRWTLWTPAERTLRMLFAFAFIPFVKDWIGLPTEYVAAGRLFLTGGGLIAFILFRQSGIVPERVGGRRYV